ncbi:MAG: class A beta-lactamase-related serine hydrolase [Chloroflexi bacterium]|nr:class A beta-lactamase-related serine hydrolase [Chloroflexota bacterium]
MKTGRTFIILLLAALTVYLGPRYTAYRASHDAIPLGVSLAGANIGGATAAAAAQNLRQVFESPVLVEVGADRLVLRPADIGFEIDAEQMVAEAQTYGRGWYALRDFSLFLLERPPLGGNISLIYSYDRDKMGAWLQDMADSTNHPPIPGYANLDTLQFVPGQPGRNIDLNQTAKNILDAFSHPVNRVARTAIIETETVPPDMASLEAAMRQRLEQFPGIYSVYMQDLITGAEIDIDGDTAFAGMSTVKIPIFLKIYLDNELPLSPQISDWISTTVRSPTASNASANALLASIGDGDRMVGAQRVTDLVREMGFKNTFIASPYDSKLSPPVHRTPANTNPAYNTNPDPAMQTTPKDIGRILAEIGTCAEGKGNLIAAYADRITPAKCKELIGWLEQNPLGWLIRYGVPADARVAHKHGYAPDSQGDVALIYGPEGPYVLSIFVYQAGWVVWDISNPLMYETSRLVWNFYLAQTGQQQLPPFPPPATTEAGS